MRIPEPYRVDWPKTKSLKLTCYPGLPDEFFHFHREYEFVLALGSNGLRMIGDHVDRYSVRDMVLLGPNIPHTWLAEEAGRDSLNYVIHFTRESLGLEFLDKNELTPVKELLNKSSSALVFSEKKIREIKPLLDRLFAGDDFYQVLLFLEILYRLGADDDMKELGNESRQFEHLMEDYRTFSKVLQFIQQNYTSKLTLNAAAKSVHMSVPSFTRFFKRYTGKSFMFYINEWRINKACQLLKSSRNNVLEISEQVGFRNLSNFNRQFLNHTEKTPRQYRMSRLQSK